MQANLGVSTVLYESGRFRLWYGASKGDGSLSCVCRAEGEDGFTWDRPDLGPVGHEGSTRNNILYQGQAHHVDAVFADPVAPPHERYKGVAARGVYYRDGRPDPTLDKEQFKELLVALDLGASARRAGAEVRGAAAAPGQGVCHGAVTRPSERETAAGPRSVKQPPHLGMWWAQ